MRQFNHLRIILLFLAACSISSMGQTVTLSTNNIQVNVTSLGLVPATVRTVTIQGQYWAAYGNTIYANNPQKLTVASYPNLTNGIAIFTNQICGLPYQLTVSTYYTTLVTNYFIPSTAQPDGTGNVNVGQYLGSYMSPTQFFWSNPYVTNYNYAVQGGGVYWNTNSSTNGATPGKLVWIIATPPFNSTNYPHGIIYTN